MARKVDDLGRIVLPIELRRLHGIRTGDALEISVDGESIVLRKLPNGCVFCGSEHLVASFRERLVCARCRRDLAGDGGTTGDDAATPEDETTAGAPPSTPAFSGR